MNDKKVNKPVSLIVEESKQTIITAINSTGLNITILEMIMKDLYNEVKQKAQYQYELEKASYENAMAEIEETAQQENKIDQE